MRFSNQAATTLPTSPDHGQDFVDSRIDADEWIPGNEAGELMLLQARVRVVEGVVDFVAKGLRTFSGDMTRELQSARDLRDLGVLRTHLGYYVFDAGIEFLKRQRKTEMVLPATKLDAEVLALRHFALAFETARRQLSCTVALPALEGLPDFNDIQFSDQERLRRSFRVNVDYADERLAATFRIHESARIEAEQRVVAFHAAFLMGDQVFMEDVPMLSSVTELVAYISAQLAATRAQCWARQQETAELLGGIAAQQAIRGRAAPVNVANAEVVRKLPVLVDEYIAVKAGSTEPAKAVTPPTTVDTVFDRLAQAGQEAVKPAPVALPKVETAVASVAAPVAKLPAEPVKAAASAAPQAPAVAEPVKTAAASAPKAAEPELGLVLNTGLAAFLAAELGLSTDDAFVNEWMDTKTGL